MAHKSKRTTPARTASTLARIASDAAFIGPKRPTGQLDLFTGQLVTVSTPAK